MASLVFWLFTFCLFGIVQTIQLSEHQNPLNLYVSDEDAERQLIVVLIGCIAFAVGGLIGLSRGENATARPVRQLSVRRTVVASLVVLCLSVFFFRVFGGTSTLFNSRQALGDRLAYGQDTVSPGRILMAGLANVGPFMCLFALCKLRASGALEGKDKILLLLLTCGLVVSNILFNNPISQPRYWIATISIAALISGPWISKLRFQIGFAAGFVVVALILFPFLDAFRYEHAVAHAHSGIVQTYLNKTDYSSPQDVTNVVSYVGQYGHTGGRQLLGTALFAVPRSVWPDKPTDTAIVVAHYVNSHLLNLDSPLWAEGYIDFGIPGAALMLGVFGMLAGRADVHLLSRERSSAVAVLTPAFVGYELILLRGSLLQAMGRITLIVLFAYLLSEKQVTRVRGI